MSYSSNSEVRLKSVRQTKAASGQSKSKAATWIRTYGALLLWAATALTLHAQTFTLLHSFSGPDGSSPSAQLVQGTDGNLYGATALGGPGLCRSGCGTIFKISPAGTLTTIHKFNVSDGDGPSGAMVAEVRSSASIWGLLHSWKRVRR